MPSLSSPSYTFFSFEDEESPQIFPFSGEKEAMMLFNVDFLNWGEL